jgi:hypothetical protein
MTELVIALSIAVFFAAAWSAGRCLPKVLAACFPIAVVVAVAVVVITVGLTGVRDWLMAGVVICITVVVTSAGRDARRKARGLERTTSDAAREGD